MRVVQRRRFLRRGFRRSPWFLIVAIFLIVLLGAGFLGRPMWLAR